MVFGRRWLKDIDRNSATTNIRRSDYAAHLLCLNIKARSRKKNVPGHNNSLLVGSRMRDPSKTSSSAENISSFASRPMQQHNIVRCSPQKIMKSKILRTQRQRKSLSPRALPLNCSTTPLLKPFYNIL
jgi:hypothetical protein